MTNGIEMIIGPPLLLYFKCSFCEELIPFQCLVNSLFHKVYFFKCVSCSLFGVNILKVVIHFSRISFENLSCATSMFSLLTIFPSKVLIIMNSALLNISPLVTN